MAGKMCRFRKAGSWACQALSHLVPPTSNFTSSSYLLLLELDILVTVTILDLVEKGVSTCGGFWKDEPRKDESLNSVFGMPVCKCLLSINRNIIIYIMYIPLGFSANLRSTNSEVSGGLILRAIWCLSLNMSHKPSLTASLSSRRRKCQTPTFGTACTYCVDRGLPCTRDTQSIVRPIRPPEVNQNQKILPSAPSIDSVVSPRILPEPYHASGLPPKELCLELARLYIDYIHDQFHSLFHPPSLLQDVEAGRAPPVIVFAIMALSAR